ncbi:MAG: WD40/YVTN/BNR-like repeat-containing protein, partial [Acidimicrobiia bacterium]
MESAPGVQADMNAATSIESVAFEVGSGFSPTLYVTADQGQELGKPYVFTSVDEGKTWTRSDLGLPGVGSIIELEASQSDPSIAYLLLEQSIRSPDHEGDLTLGPDLIYVTHDAGGSWTMVSSPTGFNDLAIDAHDSRSLWAATGSGLMNSTTGGRTWTGLEGVSRPLGYVAINQERGNVSEVIATDAFTGRAYRWTANGGVSTLTTAGVATSAASSIKVHALVLAFKSSSASVMRYDLRSGIWYSLKSSGSPIDGLTVDRTDSPSLFGHTDEAVMKYQLDGRGMPAPPSLGAPQLPRNLQETSNCPPGEIEPRRTSGLG